MCPNPIKRSHLESFNRARISHRFTDVLVIGSGVAGLSAAIAAADGTPRVEVLLIAKAELSEGSTQWAQGGIAAVLDPEQHSDRLDYHVDDTVRAGCELSDPDVVSTVVSEGVDGVRALLDWGAAFDREGGALHFTQEGGHSHPRILHSADSTGREIERVLLSRALDFGNITSLARTFAIDLAIRADGTCRGALVYRPTGVLQMLWAKRVILATGGAGRLYRETTNPPVTTGDGLAMAFRAGARLRDLEFVQFHPTTLYVAGADRFLITEAARGEGGRIVDADGEPFMHLYHPKGDLAPRDVVSRGIVQHMKETGTNKVFLDLSSLSSDHVRRHFPQIQELCARFGIDIPDEPIPVRPSAHYTLGGVVVDRDGATDVPGLFAVGEVSSTGLHGANRLGSNSLLEGLVYGKRAGARVARECAELDDFRPPFDDTPLRSGEASTTPRTPPLNLQDLQQSLQSLLWRHAGIERTGDGLRDAIVQIREWISYVLPGQFAKPEGWTLQNMLTTAFLIVRAALRREESRGVHSRSDFPDSSEAWRKHQTVSRLELKE